MLRVKFWAPSLLSEVRDTNRGEGLVLCLRFAPLLSGARGASGRCGLEVSGSSEGVRGCFVLIIMGLRAKLVA